MPRLSVRSLAALSPLLALLACAPATPRPASTAGPGRDELTFRVEAREEPVAGALVYLARGGSLTSLGRSGADGELTLAKRDVARLKGSALLFCWDDASLACTALRLDTRRLAAFDWLNVELPSKRLIDPEKVRLRRSALERRD